MPTSPVRTRLLTQSGGVMTSFELLERIAIFNDLCELMQHPMGVDPTREVIAELHARWSELHHLGLETHPAIEAYLARVMPTINA